MLAYKPYQKFFASQFYLFIHFKYYTQDYYFSNILVLHGGPVLIYFKGKNQIQILRFYIYNKNYVSTSGNVRKFGEYTLFSIAQKCLKK